MVVVIREVAVVVAFCKFLEGCFKFDEKIATMQIIITDRNSIKNSLDFFGLICDELLTWVVDTRSISSIGDSG